MPILAVPYLLPFAEAAGIAIAGLGLMEISKQVQKFMDINPEETFQILKMIMPEQGIAALFNEAAEGEGDEEVIEEGEEIIDLDEDKPKRKRSKKEIILEALRKKKGSYASPEAKGSWASPRGRIIKGLAEEGLIPDKPDPNYDPDKKFKGYKKYLKKADGGRVGFQTGGALDRSTLNERGQAIYDSMKASRQSDQSIIDQLTVLGLYNTGTDEGITSIVNIAPGITQGGGGGDGGGGGAGIINAYDPNQNLGVSDLTDYEAEAYGKGPTFRGTLATLKDAYSRYSPMGFVGRKIKQARNWWDEQQEQKNQTIQDNIRAQELATLEQQKAFEAQRAEQALQQSVTHQANQEAARRIREDPNVGRDYGHTQTRSSSGWDTGDPFKKGGLATMFERRR